MLSLHDRALGAISCNVLHIEQKFFDLARNQSNICPHQPSNRTLLFIDEDILPAVTFLATLSNVRSDMKSADLCPKYTIDAFSLFYKENDVDGGTSQCALANVSNYSSQNSLTTAETRSLCIIIEGRNSVKEQQPGGGMECEVNRHEKRRRLEAVIRQLCSM